MQISMFELAFLFSARQGLDDGPEDVCCFRPGGYGMGFKILAVMGQFEDAKCLLVGKPGRSLVFRFLEGSILIPG